jgi:hypothetical protein
MTQNILWHQIFHQIACNPKRSEQFRQTTINWNSFNSSLIRWKKSIFTCRWHCYFLLNNINWCHLIVIRSFLMRRNFRLYSLLRLLHDCCWMVYYSIWVAILRACALKSIKVYWISLSHVKMPFWNLYNLKNL